MYEAHNFTGCKYGYWEDIAYVSHRVARAAFRGRPAPRPQDFYPRFNWTADETDAAIGNNAFLSMGELEEYILGDFGNARGDRTPHGLPRPLFQTSGPPAATCASPRRFYDAQVTPTQWLFDDVDAMPTWIYVYFSLGHFELNEHNNKLHVNGRLRLMWIDQRLAYAMTPDCEDAFGNAYHWS